MPGDAQAPVFLPGAVALLFAAIHLLSPWLTFLDRSPRSFWLSFGGGVSVAYVIVHLIPELVRLQEKISAPDNGEETIFVFALAGLVAFYAVESVVGGRSKVGETNTPPGAFWTHIASFALYNFLIGYLLEEQARQGGIIALLLYAVAMGLHFTINDRALYGQHGARYLERGRWWLALAVLAGWGTALAYEIPEFWVIGAFALLAGSVIFNVMKEELPEERESPLWAFVLGAAGYTALLLLV